MRNIADTLADWAPCALPLALAPACLRSLIHGDGGHVELTWREEVKLE